jgi:ribose 1,5-bisphosphokinase
MTGRIIAVVGASGVGKDTLLAGAAAVQPRLHWASRVITRPENPGGEPHEGVSHDSFARRMAAGAFALHWTAHGISYALPWSALTPRNSGGDVVFNGSRKALAHAFAVFPALEVVEVTADPAIIAARLAARGREDAADIAARLARGGLTLPQGVRAIRIANDGTAAEGVAQLLAALYPVSATLCDR